MWLEEEKFHTFHTEYNSEFKITWNTFILVLYC